MSANSDITKAARSQMELKWKSQRASTEGELVKDFSVFRTSCGIIDLCNVRKIPNLPTNVAREMAFA